MLRKSLLWQIRSLSHPNVTSYVFGTMHVKDEKAFSHFEKALNKLYRCETYYGEMDLKASQHDIDMSEYLLPNGYSLIDYMGLAKYSKMKKRVLKTYNVNLDQLMYLKPLIILTKITESVLNEDNLRPLDYVLWQKADALNMNMKGLEKVEEQVATMRSLPIESQLKMLSKALTKINQIRKSTFQLLNYYENEDINYLFKATKKSLGAFRKVLLYNRNQVMAERIAENAFEPSFYAIGAAHLAGHKGVLAKLKRMGFSVSAVQ